MTRDRKLFVELSFTWMKSWSPSSCSEFSSLIWASLDAVTFSRESNDKDSCASSIENPGVKITDKMSDMDMFESVVSESDASEVIVPVEFSVMLRMSEMDMFESAVDVSDGVVVPVNFDSVMLRM